MHHWPQSFHHYKELALFSLCWLQNKPLTLQSEVLIEKTVGPVKFTMVIVGLNVLSINLNTDSPSWSYDSRVGLVFSYCLCYNNGKPYIANCTFKLHSHSPYV
jgi:hypothetical protein